MDKDVKKGNQLKCVLINARSLSNKSSFIIDYCSDMKIDIAIFTETRLHYNSPALAHISSSVYSFINFPRIGRGGVLGLLYKSYITINSFKTICCSSAEIASCSLSLLCSSIKLVIIYRPPNRPLQQFFSDLSSLIVPII